MSTPKRSGQTDAASVMTNSRMLAWKSQRAALSPAAYGPSAWSISSIWNAAGSDSTSGMARIVAPRSDARRSWLAAKKSRQKAASAGASSFGR